MNLRIEYILPSFRHHVHSQEWRQSFPKFHLTKEWLGSKFLYFIYTTLIQTLGRFLFLLLFSFSDKETSTYLERLSNLSKVMISFWVDLSSETMAQQFCYAALVLKQHQQKRYFLLRDYFVPSKRLNVICMCVWMDRCGYIHVCIY